MNWVSGHILQNGKYVIDKELGEGGFGTTYLALKSPLDKKVVIKTPQIRRINSFRTDEEKQKYKKGFQEEADKLNQCRHPNIVQIEEVLTEGSLPCIVMEYIEGQTLYDIVKTQGFLPEREALKYIKQIANAVHLIHEKGLVHRDVKPNNIILRSNSKNAVLIDFGIARQYISGVPLTSYNTDGFSPLEQYYPDRHEGRYTDIYALSATLYYLLVGDPPPFAWMRQPVDNLVPPKQRNPNISDQTNEAILKGLEVEPTERPSSVQEWLEMLPQETGPDPGPGKLNIINFEVVYLDVRGQERNREQHEVEVLEQMLRDNPVLTLEMVKIPGGTYLMGSPEREMVKHESKLSKLTERPQRQVRIEAFFMSRFPIAQAIWKFIADLPKVQIDLNPDCSRFQEDENNPVEQVSWFQAQEFCARLSQFTRLNYRLPSEAEWEYACKAGMENKPFHFGDTITTQYANYDGTESYNYEPMGEFHKQTKSVGSFGVANAFGLSDMHGNVWEWCADPQHDTYEGAPLDGRSWDIEEAAEPQTILRVLRGGAWETKAGECRAANRKFVRPNRSRSSFGFRVALSNFLVK
ncbi:bifunctional serine/threonine-protein kinase/formylglycine-generating enzyme family protein [Laspinema olomoucense]|uniref:bifunctional serine/threonine-protein kinase/formylglycine-generating enzyme family protein n=1 Tax=Laspinema olomoucense TaxID=3231600 RepID=UPI0021BB50DC|nr:bifunctional serine/threonine-protein kinase/formylglycine-generating enzyme family protein [Laspinema sp. D3c]MCT7995529.1 bifunctional serine/threonine-protein kinase/formylglycine-generating enzyme family protein [Laspinema sp. D3c]